MDLTASQSISIAAGGGLIAGLALLVRGLRGYQGSVQVGDTAGSTISSAAAGEVRISGVIEPAELALVSLLQSASCVYYRATIGGGGLGPPLPAGFTEERAIGFRVRDASGSLRVFPRGARVEAPVRFDDETAAAGDEPIGLSIRLGGATKVSELDRATAVAELLRVHERTDPRSLTDFADRRGRRHYRESRLEPGDLVTIVGRALPFADLADPAGADFGTERDGLASDPEVEADLADARAAGLLAGDAEAAWGNAAIPGFGIGRPVATPTLDPAAHRLPLATAVEAARTERTFEISPETLVLAAAEGTPLLIAYGAPDAVVERSQWTFTLGLLGAVLAIGSAMVVAVNLAGGFGL